MRWRRRLITLHRDVGYLCVGLTLAYCISGVAMNHRHQWNYNQSTTTETLALGSAPKLLGTKAPSAGAPADSAPLPEAAVTRLAREHQAKLVQAIVRQLDQSEAPRKAFWRGPRRLSLFFGDSDRDLVDYDPVSGHAQRRLRQDRLLLRQLNFLHLNESPRIWTWLADFFAVALAFLACSGVFLVKGKRGLKGRGGWLLAAGVAIPTLAILLL